MFLMSICDSSVGFINFEKERRARLTGLPGASLTVVRLVRYNPHSAPHAMIERASEYGTITEDMETAE